MTDPAHQIRARFSNDTTTVYQTYASQIAVPALAAGRFVPPFKRDRMTWIKPSFLWMMYRSGWAEKPGQEHVLAIEITRTGFEWALERAYLSHFDAAHHGDHTAWSRQLKATPSASSGIPSDPCGWSRCRTGRCRLGSPVKPSIGTSWSGRLPSPT